jgi:small nuclear ribonucleoprotein G
MELKLNGGRMVTGTLRGYDQFMNVVLDQATEIRSPTEKHEIGMIVVRGNSIQMWECLDKIK